MQFASPSQLLTEQASNEALMDAMAAAFGMVACSDAILESCEAFRFFDLAKDTEELSAIPWEQIKGRFEEVTNEILSKGETGREKAISLIEKIKTNKDYSEAVVSCSQIAIVSNFKVQEVEEKALHDICTALGIDPSNK